MSLDSRLRQGLIGLADDVDPDVDGALGKVSVSGRRRRVVGIATAVVMCIGLGAAGVFAIPRLLDETDRGRLDPTAVETFDPEGRFDVGLRLSSRPGGMTVAAGSLWVAVPGEQRVLRLDARTGEQRAAVSVDGEPCGEPGFLADLNWVWFGSCRNDEVVWMIDADRDAVAETLVPATGIAGGSGRRFWTWRNDDHTINLYDQSEGELEKFRVWNTTNVFDALLWRKKVFVTDEERGVLSPINTRTGAFPDVRVGRSAGDVEVGVGAVWVADDIAGAVVRFDPKSQKVVGKVRVAPTATTIDVALFAGSVWARTEGKVVRIDPRSLEIEESVRVPEGGGSLAPGEGGLWVSDPENDGLLRLPLD